MLATFDHKGDVLICVQRDDQAYKQTAELLKRTARSAGLVSERDLLEEGFTGEIKDELGRRRKYVDGKQVPIEKVEPPKTRRRGSKLEAKGKRRAVSAKLNGRPVKVVGMDRKRGIAHVKDEEGRDRVVRKQDLIPDPDPVKDDEPESPEADPAGFQMYSPNVEEGVKFQKAVENLGGQQQVKFLRLAEDVLDQVGVEHSAANAIGDWADGAENSVFQTITKPIDKETMRYTAALIGKNAKQKAVLTFSHDPNGADAMYQMDLPVSIAEARAKLDEKGIAFRTLVPTEQGCKVVVFDQGNELLTKILTVGDEYDVTIRQTKGSGEFIGATDQEAPDARDVADAEYDRAIAAYEKEPSRPRYDPGLHHRGRGAGQEAGAKPKDKPKSDRAGPITREATTPPPPGSDALPVYDPDPAAKGDGGVAQHSRVGVPADQVPPPPPIGRLPRLTKNERLVESRFTEKFQSDPEAMVGAYLSKKANVVGAVVKAKHHANAAAEAEAAGFKVQVKNDKAGQPDEIVITGSEPELSAFLGKSAPKHQLTYEIGDAPNIFATDDAKLLSDVYNPPADSGIGKADVMGMRSRYNTVLHQTANAIAKRAFVKYLDDVVAKLPEENRTVLVTSGGVASGKGYALSRVSAVNAVASKAGAVWDAAGEQNATENEWVLNECKKRGIGTTFLFVHSDPTKTWENPQRGVVERAGKIGRMVDARLFAESYALGSKNFADFHAKHKDSADAQFFILDNTDEGKDADGNPSVLSEVPEAARNVDAEALYDRCVGYLQKAGGVNPAVKRGGLNGLKIWPTAGGKGAEARESRELLAGEVRCRGVAATVVVLDPRRGLALLALRTGERVIVPVAEVEQGRDLAEADDGGPGFTGEITDSIGRKVRFLNGKRVKRVGEEGYLALHQVQPTWQGRKVSVLSHDSKTGRARVRDDEHGVIVVNDSDLQYGDKKPAAATKKTPSPWAALPPESRKWLDRPAGSPRVLDKGFTGFVVDQSGTKYIFKDGIRTFGQSLGDGVLTVNVPKHLTQTAAEEIAQSLNSHLAVPWEPSHPTSIHNVPSEKMQEWFDAADERNRTMLAFYSLADRGRSNQEAVKLNQHFERQNAKMEWLASKNERRHRDDEEPDEDEDENQDEDEDREEWDGEIDQYEVDATDYEHIQTWSSYPDGTRDSRREHVVELSIGEFTPPGYDEPVEVYRWQSADVTDGDADEAGDWTTDRREAERDGERYADRNDQEEPDEVGLNDDEIDDLFGAADLGLDVQRERGEPNIVHLYHDKIEECYRTFKVDGDGRSYIHNDYFRLKVDYLGDGFGSEVFKAEVDGARAAGFAYIDTQAARADVVNGFNGYYTWLTLGYDQVLNRLDRGGSYGGSLRDIRRLAPEANTLQDFFQRTKVDLTEDEKENLRTRLRKLLEVAKGNTARMRDEYKKNGERIQQSIAKKIEKTEFSGADWWLAHGWSVDVAFSLREGSGSLKTLEKAFEKKAARKKAMESQTEKS